MLKHFRNKMDDKNLVERGFTLIELLIVIVILGILAAVVVFAVGNIGDKGKSASCDTDKQTILTAIEAYRASTGHNPSDTPSMATLSSSSGFLTKDSSLYTLSYSGGAPVLAAISGSGCS